MLDSSKMTAASIAQGLEHWSCKPGVVSSNLTGGYFFFVNQLYFIKMNLLKFFFIKYYDQKFFVIMFDLYSTLMLLEANLANTK